MPALSSRRSPHRASTLRRSNTRRRGTGRDFAAVASDPSRAHHADAGAASPTNSTTTRRRRPPQGPDDGRRRALPGRGRHRGRVRLSHLVQRPSVKAPPPVIRASTEPSKVAPPPPAPTRCANKISYDRFGDRGQNEQVVRARREAGRVSGRRAQRPAARRVAGRADAKPAPRRAGAAPAAANPPSVLGEPKRVRTVPIRPDGPDAAAAPQTAAPPPVAPPRQARRAGQRAARPRQSGSAAAAACRAPPPLARHRVAQRAGTSRRGKCAAVARPGQQSACRRPRRAARRAGPRRRRLRPATAATGAGVVAAQRGRRPGVVPQHPVEVFRRARRPASR